MLYVLATYQFLFGHNDTIVLGVLTVTELTTVYQNTWSLVRYRHHDPAKATALLKLSPFFYGFYSLVKGIVGPLFYV
ncbi:hypothetical protein C2S51_010367 [Perilla frutescens var. frutescens]|nr:hypothetical protein C2S51_010367 [Perilla frutescens var. frutescens]